MTLGVTKTYSYNNNNRLTSVMRGVLEEDRFNYDSVGNRLSDIQRRNYTYNNVNELLSQNGTSFSYDANGNMVSKTDSGGTTSYVYDSENRLVQINTQPVTGNPQLVAYKYDPFGRRIEKNVNGVITRYVYDREDILFELDANNNIITEYLHGPGIDEPIVMRRGGQTYHYHVDGLGSIIAITDSAGQVVQRYEYDSFGQITYQQDAAFKQPYTYTGREYDPESGLYYYRARYYDAKVGRFLQQDPFRGYFRKPQTQNRYIYVRNNPLNLIDPWGLWEYAGEYGTTGEGLTNSITSIENTVDNAFNNVANRDAIATYTTNGTHSSDSLHYSGNAIDLRTRDLSKEQREQIVQRLKDALGNNYDVIDEGDHIHIEYDYKYMFCQ